MAAAGRLIVGVSSCPCRLASSLPSSTEGQCRLRGTGTGFPSRTWTLSSRVRASSAAAPPKEESETDEGPGLLRQSSILTRESINAVLATGELLETVDHYGRLGVAREASAGEIRRTYRKLLVETEGKDIPGEEKDAIVRGLRESYELLTSVEERRLYDWSLDRSVNDVYVWPHESDVTQRDYAPATYTNEADAEGNKTHAYFYLGWFALSVILNVFFHNPT